MNACYRFDNKSLETSDDCPAALAIRGAVPHNDLMIVHTWISETEAHRIDKIQRLCSSDWAARASIPMGQEGHVPSKA
jgi:hypothetical protein